MGRVSKSGLVKFAAGTMLLALVVTFLVGGLRPQGSPTQENVPTGFVGPENFPQVLTSPKNGEEQIVEADFLGDIKITDTDTVRAWQAIAVNGNVCLVTENVSEAGGGGLSCTTPNKFQLEGVRVITALDNSMEKAASITLLPEGLNLDGLLAHGYQLFDDRIVFLVLDTERVTAANLRAGQVKLDWLDGTGAGSFEFDTGDLSFK